MAINKHLTLGIYVIFLFPNTNFCVIMNNEIKNHDDI